MVEPDWLPPVPVQLHVPAVYPVTGSSDSV